MLLLKGTEASAIVIGALASLKERHKQETKIGRIKPGTFLLEWTNGQQTLLESTKLDTVIALLQSAKYGTVVTAVNVKSADEEVLDHIQLILDDNDGERLKARLELDSQTRRFKIVV